MKRGLLPQEAGPAAPTPGPANHPGTPAPAAPLVFQVSPGNFVHHVAEFFSRDPEQDHVLPRTSTLSRALSVKNQMDKGPSRAVDALPGAPGGNPGQPVAPVAPTAPGAVDANGVPVPPFARQRPASAFATSWARNAWTWWPASNWPASARHVDPVSVASLLNPHPSPSPPMIWVQQNYDRFLLALFAALLLACAGLLFYNAHNYTKVFEEIRGAVHQKRQGSARGPGTPWPRT